MSGSSEPPGSSVRRCCGSWRNARSRWAPAGLRVAAVRRSPPPLRRRHGHVRGIARRLLRRPRPGDRRCRRSARARVGAEGGGRRRARRRQLRGVPHGGRRPPRRRRGQPRGSRGPPTRHCVLSELHHDGARHGLVAVAEGGGDRTPGRLHLPVGVGRGCPRDRGARRAVEQVRRRCRLPAPRGDHRRLHRAGGGLVQADRGQRDPARRIGDAMPGTRARNGSSCTRVARSSTIRPCASPRRASASRSTWATR